MVPVRVFGRGGSRLGLRLGGRAGGGSRGRRSGRAGGGSGLAAQLLAQFDLARTETAAHRVDAVFEGAVRGLCSHAVDADGAARVFAAAQRAAGLRVLQFLAQAHGLPALAGLQGLAALAQHHLVTVHRYHRYREQRGDDGGTDLAGQRLHHRRSHVAAVDHARQGAGAGRGQLVVEAVGHHHLAGGGVDQAQGDAAATGIRGHLAVGHAQVAHAARVLEAFDGRDQDQVGRQLLADAGRVLQTHVATVDVVDLGLQFVAELAVQHDEALGLGQRVGQARADRVGHFIGTHAAIAHGITAGPGARQRDHDLRLALLVRCAVLGNLCTHAHLPVAAHAAVGHVRIERACATLGIDADLLVVALLDAGRGTAALGRGLAGRAGRGRTLEAPAFVAGAHAGDGFFIQLPHFVLRQDFIAQHCALRAGDHLLGERVGADIADVFVIHVHMQACTQALHLAGHAYAVDLRHRRLQCRQHRQFRGAADTVGLARDLGGAAEIRRASQGRCFHWRIAGQCTGCLFLGGCGRIGGRGVLLATGCKQHCGQAQADQAGGRTHGVEPRIRSSQASNRRSTAPSPCSSWRRSRPTWSSRTGPG